MTERERLIELINDVKDIYPTIPIINGMRQDSSEVIADHLLSNGVIVSPFNVGDTVYYPVRGTSVVYETKVYAIGERRGEIAINPKEYPIDAITMYGVEFGKTVFLTKDEAEKALKERSEGK